ncbi:hypothetical protein JOM56_003009 [Amanita muscaria]
MSNELSNILSLFTHGTIAIGGDRYPGSTSSVTPVAWRPAIRSRPMQRTVLWGQLALLFLTHSKNSHACSRKRINGS